MYEYDIYIIHAYKISLLMVTTNKIIYKVDTKYTKLNNKYVNAQLSHLKMYFIFKRDNLCIY